VTSPSVVEATGLRKTFGERVAVDGIDLYIPRGQCFGLLGPNGAGKTTTLRILLGLTPFDAGDLRVLGLEMPAQGRSVRARVGVVPQADTLDPDFSVAETLSTYASYFGIRRAQAAARIDNLLSFASLTERRDARIDALSGGMKRRLTVARALINDPELMVLDEPTTGLDPQARHVIWARLADLRSAGKTLLLTTHYMEEAERLCDELVIIDHGRILDRGSPRELIARHVEPEVIEVRGGADRVAAWPEAQAIRHERMGSSLYCHTDQPAALVTRLQGVPGLVFLHRPAGLEDVFLRLTGRDLRD
jgi:lipooligosaccharide transport system ATP-binding protein